MAARVSGLSQLLVVALLMTAAATARAGDDIEGRVKPLLGYWLAAAETPIQARVLRITNVIFTEPGSAVLAGFYGPPAAVLPEAKDISVRVEGAAIVLEIVGADGTTVKLTGAAGDRLQGTERHPDGRIAARRFARAALADYHRFTAENPQPDVRAGRGAKIELVYIGADDCSLCLGWEAAHVGQRGLAASAEWKQLRFTPAKRASLKTAFRTEQLPERLRPAFNAMMAQGVRIYGVPSFVLLVNDTLRVHALGPEAFDTLVHPALRAAVREKLSAERGY